MIEQVQVQVQVQVIEDLPMSSVVYMGRGSFRMEAVSIEEDGSCAIVQPALGVVTAPHGLGAANGDVAPRERDATRRDDHVLSPGSWQVSSESWQVPGPLPLFGSQDNVPLLAPPTGGVVAPRVRVVDLSRATLGGLCALLFGLGLGVADLTGRVTISGPASAVAASLPPSSVPAVATLARVGAQTFLPPSEEVPVPAAAPATIEIQQSLKISARKVAPRHVAVGRTSATPRVAKRPWVDPFAD